MAMVAPPPMHFDDSSCCSTSAKSCGLGDEKQPVAARRGRAGVARARNLVHRLEHHPGARGARDFGRAIRGVVVADDELGRPAARGEDLHAAAQVLQRCGEELLFVERRDDDRELHSP
jgi:hypothetical protein